MLEHIWARHVTRSLARKKFLKAPGEMIWIPDLWAGVEITAIGKNIEDCFGKLDIMDISRRYGRMLRYPMTQQTGILRLEAKYMAIDNRPWYRAVCLVWGSSSLKAVTLSIAFIPMIVESLFLGSLCHASRNSFLKILKWLHSLKSDPSW